MPMHDWSKVEAGVYHDFHQGWTIELRNALNRGVLPPGYFAMADQRVGGPEPDVAALRSGPPADMQGGLAVADSPPQTRQKATVETSAARYARKANRLAIHQGRGRVVAILEIVSPGNKDTANSVQQFANKAAEFLRTGIHVLLVDPFPPGKRDPTGLHQVIWSELSDDAFEARPKDKPLTVASFEASHQVTAYVEPFAVGEKIPDLALFLEPGWYVFAPLEASYQAAWDALPKEVRQWVA
ncbi:MAG: DUF4058 family protein [Gemmataceae bacterium]|nr:DUF4058 family protein [Gemmataceae bacterium]